MFIWTAKLRRGRLVAGVAAIVVLCGAVALVGGVLSARGVDAVSPAPASPKGIKTNEDRIAYLESYGWQDWPCLDTGGAALINERRAVFFCLLERLGCLIEKHQVQDASHEHDQRHYNQQQGGRNVDDRHQDQHSADNGY